MDRQVRRSIVEPGRTDLSILRQCRLLSISRSIFYAQPSGEIDENLAIMTEIDRQFLDTPFYSVRQMTWHLRAKGWQVNDKRIRRLMRKMGPGNFLDLAIPDESRPEVITRSRQRLDGIDTDQARRKGRDELRGAEP